MSRRDHYEIIAPGPNFAAVQQLECFSAELAHRRRLPLIIDMNRVAFIRPLAVIGLVMFLDAMLARGRHLYIRFPTRPGVLNYLMAIGLPTVMDQLGSWDWPEDFPREAPRRVKPMVRLTRFTTTEDVDRIAEEMADVFLSEGLASLLPPCHVVFSELAENVVAHSGGPGFVLAQRYDYQKSPVIDIAVGDCGIGIRKALWRNRSLRQLLTDDREALVLAMRDGISGISSDPYRGYGLGHVSAELAAEGRWLVVRSGNASAYWRQGETTAVRTCGESVGTLVHAVIPC